LRTIFWVGLPFGFGVEKLVFALEMDKDFLSVIRNDISPDVFRENCFLAILQ